MVSEQRAVGISVKADSHIRLTGHYFTGNDFRVQRAAIFIDIAAIGSIVDKFSVDAAQLEYFRGDSAGCAIRTIHHYFESSGSGDRAGEPLDIGVVQLSVRLQYG